MNCNQCGIEFRQVRGRSSLSCSVECRFLAKVDITDPNQCWEWQGALAVTGYSYFRANGRMWLGHRFSYEIYVGPIPEGLQLDHLCRNPACVNPDHLEPVTPQINTSRGQSPSTVVVRTGVCQRGHSMDDAYVRPDGSKRTCRPCMQIRNRNRAKVSSK